MHDRLYQQIEKERPLVEGWCSAEKARSLAETIVAGGCHVAVEIGVFGGSSLIPQALAFKHQGFGRVYGVDPWTKDAALEALNERARRAWWSDDVDLEHIYHHCKMHVHRLKLRPNCTLIRDRSENAARQFQDGSVDVLHIDGNHSESQSYRDAVLYLPKVKAGGTIYFDERDGDEEGAATVQKAMRHLLDHGCEQIDRIDDCTIFKKRAA